MESPVRDFRFQNTSEEKKKKQGWFNSPQFDEPILGPDRDMYLARDNQCKGITGCSKVGIAWFFILVIIIVFRFLSIWFPHGQQTSVRSWLISYPVKPVLYFTYKMTYIHMCVCVCVYLSMCVVCIIGFGRFRKFINECGSLHPQAVVGFNTLNKGSPPNQKGEKEKSMTTWPVLGQISEKKKTKQKKDR